MRFLLALVTEETTLTCKAAFKRELRINFCADFEGHHQSISAATRQKSAVCAWLGLPWLAHRAQGQKHFPPHSHFQREMSILSIDMSTSS